MSSIAEELDRTLRSLEPGEASSLTTAVQEMMARFRQPPASRNRAAANHRAWVQRLESTAARVSTGRKGTPIQEIMDDIRGE